MATPSEPSAEVKQACGQGFLGNLWGLRHTMRQFEERFAKWCDVNLSEEELAPSDKRGCRGGIVTDQSLTVLLGMPGPPSDEFCSYRRLHYAALRRALRAVAAV